MRKVLVPVGLGDKPANQIRYAIGFSQQFKCRLIFFYADMSLIPASYTKEVYQSTVDANAVVKKQMLCNLVGRSRKRFQIKPALLHYECHVQPGTDIKEDILKLAEKEHVSMILMSTHGRSVLKKFFFGSVASGVINNTNIPVLTMPLIYKFRKIKKLVYASDLHDLAK